MTVMMDSYTAFLQNKVVSPAVTGQSAETWDVHPWCSPHQRIGIRWAARRGCGLLAWRFGLGKTGVECELARFWHQENGRKALVVCPLNVRHQFCEEDGPALGMTWQYVRTDAEVEAATTPYLITNYERLRDGNIDPRRHDIGMVSLDEGSMLRSLDSKTCDVFKDIFADVPYRYVATATPAPNEYKELIHYAEFLGVMDRGQALTRWFKRDSERAGHLTIHPQHERAFWMWVSTWAFFLYDPADIGCPNDGYNLPELRVHWHRLPVDHTRAFAQSDNRGQHKLLLNSAAGVTQAAAEKLHTLPARIDKMLEIVNADPDDHWLIWHNLEPERKAIEKALPRVTTVYGSQSVEMKEERILQFVRGQIPRLATKPKMAGSGCNFQRYCHREIFLGVDYKFHDFIQAIHRVWRFLQPYPVDCHILHAESEDAVVEELMRKWQEHDRLCETMREITRKYGLDHAEMVADLTRSIGVQREEAHGSRFTAVHNDCVDETRRMADESVGLIHTSIPFGNHYEYTDSYHDFGHNPSDADFWRQMDYLIPDLLRVTMPGRVAAIHVKDRILYGHQTASGMMEVAPFSDECVAAFRRHGWLYEGRRTIVTDVVRENASTYRLGYTEMTKDAAKMGSGLPEYLLLFRKANRESETARADTPVTKSKADYSRAQWQLDAHSFWRSNGDSPLTPEELYDYRAHVARLEALEQRGGLPAGFMHEPPKSRHAWVWDDIIYMRTLNSQQSQKRRENHICPLPFDIVKRAINLYSNPGEVVYDPFAGLFTVPCVAIELGRIGHGVELNPVYWDQGVGYCRQFEEKAAAPTLFDYLHVVSGEEMEVVVGEA